MVIDNDLGNSSNNILVHHGVEGQEWGQQNGPPYPLDPNKDYSKRELRAYKKQLRKEYRKEVKRRKKFIKKYRKDEKERLKLEEAKKKAIQSGSISEVEKYKDKMTNEELREAMERINVFTDFEKTKVSDLRASNEEVNEKLKKVTYENNLRAEELKKAYGPGKGEAILDKASRITGKIGSIAGDAQKVTGLLSAQMVLKEKTYKFDKLKKDDERKAREDRENRLIERVINSGDEDLINKHANKMSNEQLQKAMDRLKMLDPSTYAVERAIMSGNKSEVNKYRNQMTTEQYKAAMAKVDIYNDEIRNRNKKQVRASIDAIVDTGDPRLYSQIYRKLSNDDMQYMLNRIELVQKLQNAAPTTTP